MRSNLTYNLKIDPRREAKAFYTELDVANAPNFILLMMNKKISENDVKGLF